MYFGGCLQVPTHLPRLRPRPFNQERGFGRLDLPILELYKNKRGGGSKQESYLSSLRKHGDVHGDLVGSLHSQ